MSKIAVCFFGITRSLTYTIGSIEHCIFQPAKELGTVASFGHFFNQTEINNPRSNEFGRLIPAEHRLISFENLMLEEPDQCLEQRGFEAIKSYGDSWNDGFRSLRNLIHQLHSLDIVTQMAMDWGPDLIVFARPDLRYLDSLRGGLMQMSDVGGDVALVPSWQHWEGGLNDRFAICTRGAAVTYGRRIYYAIDYCSRNQAPLHAELLLKDRLVTAGVECLFMDARARRIRFDGSLWAEDFAGIDIHSKKQSKNFWHRILG